jgi:hypothetical protein
MSDITIKRGEGKNIQFTITRNNAVIDLSLATFRFVVKENYEATTYLIEKTNGDFDKSQASVGVVIVNISATDSDIAAGNYFAELITIITADTDVDKSTEISFEIEKTLYHD